MPEINKHNSFLQQQAPIIKNASMMTNCEQLIHVPD